MEIQGKAQLKLKGSSSWHGKDTANYAGQGRGSNPENEHVCNWTGAWVFILGFHNFKCDMRGWPIIED